MYNHVLVLRFDGVISKGRRVYVAAVLTSRINQQAKVQKLPVVVRITSRSAFIP